MSFHEFDDDTLIRYLLSALPEDHLERIDQEAVADDDLAARLQLVEDDLVDAYANGLLKGRELERFETVYGSTARRRARTAFAQDLAAALKPHSPQASPRQRPTRRPQVWTSARGWSFAAAVVLCAALAALLVQNLQLRSTLREAVRREGAAEARNAAMAAREPVRQPAAAPDRGAAGRTASQPLASMALVLLPQTRGVGPAPILAVAPGHRIVSLDLQIQAADYREYEVALKDPSIDGIVWRSPPIAPSGASPPIVSVRVPATRLAPQHYVLDLFGVGASGARKFVETYVFQVVRRQVD